MLEAFYCAIDHALDLPDPRPKQFVGRLDLGLGRFQGHRRPNPIVPSAEGEEGHTVMYRCHCQDPVVPNLRFGTTGMSTGELSILRLLRRDRGPSFIQPKGGSTPQKMEEKDMKGLWLKYTLQPEAFFCRGPYSSRHLFSKDI